MGSVDVAVKAGVPIAVRVAALVAVLVAVLVDDRVVMDGSTVGEGGLGGRLFREGSFKSELGVAVLRNEVGVSSAVGGGVVHAASSIKMNSNAIFFN